MSEPIKVGDLVMFVKACCDRFRDGVTVFRVVSINARPLGAHCSWCGRDLPKEARASDEPVSDSGAPLSWLKRIPPLSELESEKQKEDLREPA